MTNDTNEWKHFTRRVYIDADPAELYNAWATSDGLQKWFLQNATYYSPGGSEKPGSSPAEKGDSYEWSWFGFDLVSKGRIEEANGKDHLKFTFGTDEEVVTVDIKENNGRIIVELLQSHLHSEAEDRKRVYLGCIIGWTYHLANLKSVYEGGLDLREKNPDTDNLVNS